MSSPIGPNPFLTSSPDQTMMDEFMGMDVSDRFSMHFTNSDCSSPVAIPHGDGTDGPPCTPCTPPHDERE
ncbi:unnamed protein product [Nippostrongylus brasiliensis]|uniref:Pleiomorphic adenoma protein-like 2 n=1 Tax=Nippostrongylus brasiliensis TaxID=27835 RepID=A0A0N4XN05_NIPBR|nr:unnamed protein product [Nippostrongylus brasiliensis]